jgi:hypothetical protein
MESGPGRKYMPPVSLAARTTLSGAGRLAGDAASTGEESPPLARRKGHPVPPARQRSATEFPRCGAQSLPNSSAHPAAHRIPPKPRIGHIPPPGKADRAHESRLPARALQRLDRDSRQCADLHSNRRLGRANRTSETALFCSGARRSTEERLASPPPPPRKHPEMLASLKHLEQLRKSN